MDCPYHFCVRKVCARCGERDARSFLGAHGKPPFSDILFAVRIEKATGKLVPE